MKRWSGGSVCDHWRRGAVCVPLFALLLVLAAAGPAGATIRYQVSLAHPEQHVLHVVMTVDAERPGIVVAMPAWNAIYQVRDFAYRVRGLHAVTHAMGPGAPSVQLLDKQTWRVVVPGSSAERLRGDVEIDYAIEWDDPGPFNSQVNAHHAFLNFAEILLYVPDRRAEAAEVTFTDVPEGWRVAAELPAGPGKNSFAASGYDALVDAPVEAGKFSQFEFDNAGAHFRVLVDAEKWDRAFLEDCLRTITKYELQLMGGAPFDSPRKEYTFIFHVGPYAEVGGGGMEHANSTAIADTSVENGAALAAHEFFHAWNVKRIRPQAFEPVDYTREQYTRALWFAEGVTSAYSAYALERTGLWPKSQFYRDLAWQIEQLEGRPARKWQSAEESSLDAWLEKYDAYNAPDRSISYYNKGQLLGVLLDLTIREATDNRKSLDDVLRRLYAGYAQRHTFYNESEGIRAAVEDVAGTSLEDFFRRYVSGTDDIPYDSFLALAGLALKVETLQTADIGFSPASAFEMRLGVAWVEPGGRAEAAGLRAGDTITEWNGKAVTWADVASLQNLPPGEKVAFRVDRDGEKLAISYGLGTATRMRYSISEMPHPSSRQRRIREGILRGVTD
jgi:predicted metalloprotease with PDZ domain